MSGEHRELEECVTSLGHRIKIGDLITAYRQGYHVVTRITQWYDADRTPIFGPEVHYRQVCDAHGIRSKHAKVEHCCDRNYCLPAQVSIDRKRNDINTIEATLNNYRKTET